MTSPPLTSTSCAAAAGTSARGSLSH
uniref:Predicted protein n=1 Tax=Hordeum vulgare subsp. vulgare TaxID=112509 RepID=F2EF84_HORVV|nr:predicted protein [Hordeum vulgare subsp. vulgare]